MSKFNFILVQSVYRLANLSSQVSIADLRDGQGKWSREEGADRLQC